MPGLVWLITQTAKMYCDYTEELLPDRRQAGQPQSASLPPVVSRGGQSIRHHQRHRPVPARARVAPGVEPYWYLVQQLVRLLVLVVREVELQEVLGQARMLVLPPSCRRDAFSPASPSGHVTFAQATAQASPVFAYHPAPIYQRRVPGLDLRLAEQHRQDPSLLVVGPRQDQAGQRLVSPVPAKRRWRPAPTQSAQQAQGGRRG